MRKAIIIVPSGIELDPQAEPEIREVAALIVRNTVIVRTPECTGEAVLVADTIITSLLLVGNHTMVTIIAPVCGETQAVVSVRDERNYLAKLEPIELSPKNRRALGQCVSAKIGPIGAIGDPLFTTDAMNNRPVVTIAGMSYIVKVCERKENDPNIWRMDRRPPDGQIGGGVWSTDGLFVGLSLARKMPYNNVGSLARERLFALPAEDVMNFAETK